MNLQAIRIAKNPSPWQEWGVSAFYGCGTQLLSLEAIAWSTEHHTMTALAEQQVNERANKGGRPDDYEPENGTSHRMLILKDHHGFNDVTDDRDEDDYQEKQ